MSRTYTVAEIDTMRRAVEKICMLEVANQSFYQDEMNKKIEDRLRTYMINGTEPAELTKSVNRRIAEEQNESYRLFLLQSQTT